MIRLKEGIEKRWALEYFYLLPFFTFSLKQTSSHITSYN